MHRASEDGNDLLDRWRRGDRDDSAWFRLLREPMTRAAWKGIQAMTGRAPRVDDVDSVVHDAFLEFLDIKPDTITTPIGLAYRIAYRRGQDMGRVLNRRREFPNSEVVDSDLESFQPMVDPPLSPEENVLETEQAEEQERLTVLARECFEELPTGQMEVVRATILDQQNLSDWAHEEGKSYQAADQQRKRALRALLNCVKDKLGRGGGDDVGRQR